ncbi:MAG: helix-turn-helix domain-containing protein [Rhodanobacter sp.]
MQTKPSPVADVARAQLQDMGRRIRARRKHLGVNATAAAESAGMSRITWYRIEKGEPTVAAGAYANALVTLGLVRWTLSTEAERVRESVPAGWLPAVVRIADYSELKRLTWNSHGVDTLSPRDALATYERNWRHLDETQLDERERALIDALRQAFSGETHSV